MAHRNGAPRGRVCIGLLLAAVMLLVAACEKDPHDPKTWIPKLDNTNSLREAVQNLDRLKDLQAVKPLGEAWKKHGKPSFILRAMISIASFNDPTGDKAYIKRTPDYTDALPYLSEAVEQFDAQQQTSIEDAAVAAEALGRSKLPDAVRVLVAAANKPVQKNHPALRVKRAAISALGGFNDPTAIDTLIKVLSADPADQDIRLHAAAALALAESGNPKALPALAKAAFVGPIFNQVRAGFSRGGKAAIPVAIEIFDGKQADVLALAKEKKWEAQVVPGVMGYIGAILLGDLRATEALPKLIGALEKPAIPIQVGATATNVHGVIQALRLIGGPKAAEALYAFMTKADLDKAVFLADTINAYSMIADDTKALPFLEKIIVDEDPAMMQARVAAAIGYARLGKTKADEDAYKRLLAGQEKRGKELDADIKSGRGDDAKNDQAKLDNENLVKVMNESVARLDIGVKCTADADPPTCYAKTLSADDLAVGKPGLPRAERAMLELGKMGDKGAKALDTLLDPKNAGSDQRFVREPLLMALTRIAPLPCKQCAEKLEKVIEGQSQQTTLDDLNRETRLVYHYFLWADKR
jgi:HEAT repeat protein